MPYEPKNIEARWQAYWREKQTFRAEIVPGKPKYYVLDMFPYPSGDGLHVGHLEGYTATDIMARYKRMRGFAVLHPMGWDAFGLPAEQYAVKTGTHPRDTTQSNIANFRRQIESVGFSYDWNREVNTTDPGYFRWTQWIFQRLFERDLAYQAEVPVNWCPALGTVLANEEVQDGKSEIGGHPVERIPMRQWMLRITAYADRLLEDLDLLDWPEAIKKMQREWIGRSEGAELRFAVSDHPDTEIAVFTTRPDTLFGATYMVLAPEHPLVSKITSATERSQVESYVADAANKSERIRLAEGQKKTGAFTGAYAINPVNQQRIPIWIADYVLASYGTGAIMAVPAHDERDYAFAKQFNLPIIEVVSGGDVSEAAYTGEGSNLNSDFLDGLATQEAKRKMIDWLEEKQLGKGAITYKLRDWLFSRQRYWGEPFPVVHADDGEIRLIPDAELPLELPELDDFKPSGKLEAPLARARDWLEQIDPQSGKKILRDTNTMPQWAGSCWYYLRYCDAQNPDEAWSQEAENYWMPVDLYVGGAEHAVLHLLYARFWHKVLYDLGLVHTKEPFQKLVNQGMILGYSYRYYDDNLNDDPNAKPKTYPSSAVRVAGEQISLIESGEELRERWVDLKRVNFDSKGKAWHPEIPELELEEVTEKMSKSRGNVINPDDVIGEFGADTVRLYEMFIGPLEKSAPWSTDGIHGVYRFLQRAHRLLIEEELSPGAGDEEQQRLTAKTIAGVSDDLENMQFNTAISKLMVWLRDCPKNGSTPRDAAQTFSLLLAPFAPHLAEEIWHHLGNPNSLAYEAWPQADTNLLVEDTIRLAVSINGKRRDEIEVASSANETTIRETALQAEKVIKHLAGKEPRKVIVVPGRLVNIVV